MLVPMFTESQLVELAKAYCEATGTSFHALGNRAVNNPKFFKQLVAGKTARGTSMRIATDWFRSNWPATVQWPLKRWMVD